MLIPCTHCKNAPAIGTFVGETPKGRIVRMALCGACGFTMGEARRVVTTEEVVTREFTKGKAYRDSREVVMRTKLFVRFELETLYGPAMDLAREHARLEAEKARRPQKPRTREPRESSALVLAPSRLKRLHPQGEAHE